MGRPHGLDGEMMLRPHNRRGAELAAGTAVILERGGVREERRLERVRPTADGWLVRLDGVASRDDAAALVNAGVRMRRSALPALAPGEFYVDDLLGCAVTGDDGRALGTVQSVFWNGAHDVMVIRRDEVEHLVPVVAQVVRDVDPAAGKIVVTWDDDDG
jgi:16S rRNA processing protein RimM